MKIQFLSLCRLGSFDLLGFWVIATAEDEGFEHAVEEGSLERSLDIGGGGGG